MKTQHTKGEWRVVDSGGTVIALSQDRDRYTTICKLETIPLRISEEVEANAKLIAAAPALLTEAQKLIDNIRDYLSDVEDVNSIIPINALCEAIKKATE